MTSEILNTACKNGDLDKVQELLSSNWKPSQDELDKALYKATWGGFAKVAALLLSHGAHITDLTILGAAHNRDLDIFQEFLNYGWEINSTKFGEPALRLVIDDEACVRWFLEHGADPNQKNEDGVTPLASAALYPSITILELLISHGAELDPQALLSAISRRGRGGVPVMRCLIDHGIDINARPDQTRLLLEKGADRSIRDATGETPVEMAKSKMTRSKDAMEVYEMLSE